MANSKALFNELKTKIQIDESQAEVESIIYLMLEKKLGLTRVDVMQEKNVSRFIDWHDLIQRINRREPIQYILGEADFFGLPFRVNHNVLIPRPETELLVEEIIKQAESDKPKVIVDVGTGSGCIPILLATKLPNIKMFGIDNSDKALAMAKSNATLNNVHVDFLNCDILKNSLPVESIDYLVSNPPYITESERSSMKKNVLNFEPHQALFVTNEEPLLFYKKILEQASLKLMDGGKVFVEINERFGQEVADLFSSAGLCDVTLKKDYDGKDRIVYGTLNQKV